MFTNLIRGVQQYLTPPTYADPEQNRIASVLNAILLITLAVVTIVALGVLFAWQPMPGLLVLGGFAAVALLIRWLLCNGRLKIASNLLVIGLWLGVAFTSIFIRDSLLTNITSFFLILFVAGALLGPRAVIQLSVITAVFATGIIYADFNDWLPPSLIINTPMTLASTLVAELIGVAFLLYSGTRSYRQALAQAQRNQQALDEVVRQATAVLDGTLNREQTLEYILTLLKNVIPYDRAAVFLLEEVDLHAAALVGYQDPVHVKAMTYPADNPIFAELREIKRPLYLEDAHNNPRFDNWGTTSDIRGWMAVPLITQSHVMGYIAVSNYLPGVYDETKANIAQSFASQAVVAIENIRLFEKNRRQTYELTILNDLAKEMTAASDVQTLYHTVTNTLYSAFDLYNAAIFTVDPDAHQLILRSVAGAYALIDVIHEYRQEFGQGLIGRVAETGQLILANDTYQFPGFIQRAGMNTQSELAIPIKSTRIIGVLAVDSEQKNAFDEGMINILTTLTDQLVIVIEKLHLFEIEQHQRTRAQTLQQLGSLITSTLDVDTILRTVAEQVLALLNVRHCNILLFEPPDRLVRHITLGFPEEISQIQEQKVGEGLSGWVAAQRQPLAVYDVTVDERMVYPELARKYNLCSYLGVPMVVKDNLVGVLNINTDKPTHFDSEAIELMTAFARQVAIAVENARLFGQTQNQAAIFEEQIAVRTADLLTANHQLELEIAERQRAVQQETDMRENLQTIVARRTLDLTTATDTLLREITERHQLEQQIKHSLARRTDQVQTSTEIAQEIAATPVLDELFQQVVDLVQARFRYYHAQVYTLEKDNLIMQAGTGNAGQQMKQNKHLLPISAQKSLVVQAATSHEPILVPDVVHNAYWLPNSLLPRTKSEIAVPIILSGEVLGVLDVQADTVGGLDTEDQLLLLGLCGQIAVAINNRRLEAEQQKTEEALKAYARQLERSNRELQQSNHELERFAHLAAHHFQEPLRKIQLFSDRLQQKHQENLTAQSQDYLERIQKSAAQMQALVNDLQLFMQAATTTQPFASVDLREVAQKVVTKVESQLKLLGGRIEIGSLPTIEAVSSQMYLLLDNMVDNALKYRQPDVPLVVNIDGSVIREGLLESAICRLTISDNGIGMDVKHLDNLFNLFQRLHNQYTYDGTGLGLAVCRKIVERHDGEIRVVSHPMSGTTFTIDLPIVQSPM
jgi:GAF domain-containing protein